MKHFVSLVDRFGDECFTKSGDLYNAGFCETFCSPTENGTGTRLELSIVKQTKLLEAKRLFLNFN